MTQKIQVLLIDDYPSFALTSIRNIGAFKVMDLRPNQLDKSIPSIEDNTIIRGAIEDTDELMPDGRVTQENRTNFSEWFELKWLRNATDVREFYQLSRQIEESYSSGRLGGENGFVPEIVLFDYALTGHEDKSFPNEQDDQRILDKSVPVYGLRKIVGEEEYQKRPPMLSLDFQVYEIEKGLNSDNIGCIGGILTVNHFRNHPCIGIATTRKSDEHLHGLEARFLEIMVEEPHQFDFTLRGNANNLNWEVLLKRAAYNLRQRITILVAGGRITPSLQQLFQLERGELKDRRFSFQTVYGERHLPLDGLFVDIPDQDRLEAIKNWVTELLKKLPVTHKQIDRSIEIYQQLGEVYGALFEDRMILSDYYTRLTNLNHEEKAYLKEVSRNLHADSETGLIAEAKECSIQTLVGKDDDTTIVRLAVLLTVTNTAIQFEQKRKSTAHEDTYPPLTKWDYFNALFPCVNFYNQVLLPMHCDNDTDKSRFTGASRSWLAGHLDIDKKPGNVTEKNLFQFGDWILPGEKQILATHFYQYWAYFPAWIK